MPTRELIAEQGAAKMPEPGDPLQLVGARVPGGDVDYMARCLIEEFAGMGYAAEQILKLFRKPGYAAAHGVLRARGEAWVRNLIHEVLAQAGVFRVTEYSADSEPCCPLQGHRP